uniref:Peptidase S8/S53 n=1 Tax=uncultured Chloroflexota bacterium TaxID=166587 RepID=H5SN28_9CHLR|nr:peptidase S8/S53 [uncultured Chloroflexota bacterium]
MSLNRFQITLSLLLVGLLWSGWSSLPLKAQSPVVGSEIMAALADRETVRVIVTLHAPEPGTAVQTRIQQIDQEQTAVLSHLSDQEFKLIHRYQTIPGLVGEVTRTGLEVLLAQPQVEAVALDLPVEVKLSESVGVIKADRVWNELGITGVGVNVALLDTGVDLTHPDLADNIVAQKCFSRGACLPGNTDQGNNAQDFTGHGTHIAGIITGRGQTSPRGVAPDAGLVVVRVLTGSGAGFTSDVISGLDWVVANQAQLQVKIINLSLGGGAYQGTCDQADANTRLYAEAVRAAREVGIIIFAAAGNSGFLDKMMAPACIADVVAVGSTYDADFGTVTLANCTDENVTVDQVVCASNSSTALDLLAPGVAIDSTALGGGQSQQSGTSMSTAQASAVAALMLQANPDLTPSEIETILKNTGVPVTDHRTGRVTPRIDALAAVSAVIDSRQLTGISGRVLLQGRTDHSRVRIFLSQEALPVAASTSPTAVTQADGSFQISLPPGHAYQYLQAVYPGYLVGVKNGLEAELGVLVLPGGDVTGDGQIDLLDLSFIASRYGSHEAEADITADGLVDIFDLVIAARNYNRIGPVNDWQQPESATARVDVAFR